MKNYRKLFAVLLVAIMVAVVLPLGIVSLLANGEKTPISAVSATVAQPYDGEEQNFDAVIPENSNYTAEISHWLLSNLHVLEEGELFSKNANSYSVDVVFTPNEGYSFAEDVTATINGREAEFIGIGDSGKAYFRLELNLLLGHNVLENVRVTVKEPTVGQHLDFHPTIPEQSLYSVADVHWYATDDNNYTTELDENFVATADDAFDFYHIAVTIQVADGYMLQCDETFINGVCAHDTDMTMTFSTDEENRYICDFRAFWEYDPDRIVLKITDFESDLLMRNNAFIVKKGEPFSIKVKTNEGVYPRDTGHHEWDVFGDTTYINFELDPLDISGTITGVIPEASSNGITVRIWWRYPWGYGGDKLEVLSTESFAILVYDETSDIEFLTDSELPDGKRNQSYVQPIVDTNSIGHRINTITYSILSGSLPKGLELRYDSLLSGNYEYQGKYLFLEGTPKESGDFTFTVETVGTLTGKDIRTFTIHIDRTEHEINFADGPYGWSYTSERLPSVTLYDGATYELPKKFPSRRSGYVQVGWSTKMYGEIGDVITSITTESNQVILYPVWVKKADCPHYYGELVEAVAPTCDGWGNVAHYECISCGKLFMDEQLTVATTDEAVSLAPTKLHDMTHFEYVAPTCRINGSIEYWYCSLCGKNYEDAAGDDCLWNNPTYIMAMGCKDDNNDGTCDICNNKMPHYVMVTSESQITANSRYILVAGDKAMTLPPMVLGKNGDLQFEDYEFYKFGFPTVDVTLDGMRVEATNGATVFKGLPIYGEWKAFDGRTKNSMQTFVNGTLVALGDGNSAYIGQESKYGHCIIIDNGVAKLVSSYEGDEKTFMYSYNIVGDPTNTTYIAGASYDIKDGKYYSKFGEWDEKAQVEIPYQMENITDVILYVEQQSFTTPTNVSFDVGHLPPNVVPYDPESIKVTPDEFGGCDVVGAIDALTPGTIETIAEEYGVADGDFVGVGTKFSLKDYVESEENENNGFMSIDITPEIIIGENAVKIDSSFFNGSEMTVTVWAGKSHPNQIIHIKHDGTREYFYREGCEGAPKGAKYFTTSSAYDGEYLGEFVTFTLTDFSPIELREAILPEVKVGFAEASITLGSDITVNYYVDDDSYEAPKMKFTINEYTKTVNGVKNGAEWKFSFDGVAPQWMGDIIVAELIVDGNVVAVQNDYSVKAYLETLKATDAATLDYTDAQKAAMDKLIGDLLCYGGAAQSYTGYKTGELVSAGVTGTTFETLTTTNKAVENNDAFVTFTKANVEFSNTNKLIFKFTAADVSGVGFKISVNGGAETEIAFKAVDDYYVIITDSIMAVGFDDVYTVTAYKDSLKGASATYSVKSYIHSMQNSGNVDMANLAKATYNYGLAAKEFVAAVAE